MNISALQRQPLIGAALVLICATASAAPNSWSVLAEGGSFGLSLGVTRAFSNEWALQAELVGGTTKSSSDVVKGTSYSITEHRGALALLARYSPTPLHGLYVRGGVYLRPDGRRSLDISPSAGGYTLNGTTYSSTELNALSGSVRFNTVMPYLGLGWSTTPQVHDWRLHAELGVLYQGTPSVRLTGTTSHPQDSTAYNALLSDEWAQQRQIADALARRYVGVVWIGLSHSF